jgi:hypothetical protein
LLLLSKVDLSHDVVDGSEDTLLLGDHKAVDGRILKGFALDKSLDYLIAADHTFDLGNLLVWTTTGGGCIGRYRGYACRIRCTGLSLDIWPLWRIFSDFSATVFFF